MKAEITSINPIFTPKSAEQNNYKSFEYYVELFKNTQKPRVKKELLNNDEKEKLRQTKKKKDLKGL